MIHRPTRRGLMAAVLVMLLPWVAGAADPGKETIGSLQVDLIFGTDGDLDVLGRSVAKVDASEEKVLKGSKHMRFAKYAKLGSDRKPVLRGYENWAAPMGGSEEILLSFEPKGRIAKDAVKIDLEFWLRKQKVVSTVTTLRVGKRMYIVGPNWRDGRLIIAIELLSLMPQ